MFSFCNCNVDYTIVPLCENNLGIALVAYLKCRIDSNF